MSGWFNSESSLHYHKCAIFFQCTCVLSIFPKNTMLLQHIGSLDLYIREPHSSMWQPMKSASMAWIGTLEYLNAFCQRSFTIAYITFIFSGVGLLNYFIEPHFLNERTVT